MSVYDNADGLMGFLYQVNKNRHCYCFLSDTAHTDTNDFVIYVYLKPDVIRSGEKSNKQEVRILT